MPKPAETGAAAFQKFLKDGQVLCKLYEALNPGVCRKPHDTSKTKLAVSTAVIESTDSANMQRLNRLSLIHFQALRQNKENENISFFLQACESYGLNKADLFQVSLTSHQAKSKVKLQDG